MPHIETDFKDLKMLSFYLKYIEKSLTDEDLIKDILKYIIPKIDGQLAVNISIDNQSEGKVVGEFDPVFNSIIIRMNEIVEYIKLQYQKLCRDLKVEHDILRAYLLLVMLLHEVEHAKQFMICSKKLDFPYSIVREGYGLCFKTMLTTPKVSLIKPRKYNVDRERLDTYLRNKDSYLLERNATLEASMVLRDLAEYECDDLAYKTLDFIYRCQCYTGYEKNGRGTIEATFRELMYLDRYKKIGTDKPGYEDKVRYGFELSNDELKRLRLECRETNERMFK
jgi:hypothetical protein